MENRKAIRVRITTRNVGQAYGTEGVIKALNGRVLATTDARPYGFTAAAESAAHALAERKGFVVVEKRHEAAAKLFAASKRDSR